MLACLNNGASCGRVSGGAPERWGLIAAAELSARTGELAESCLLLRRASPGACARLQVRQGPSLCLERAFACSEQLVEALLHKLPQASQMRCLRAGPCQQRGPRQFWRGAALVERLRGGLSLTGRGAAELGSGQHALVRHCAPACSCGAVLCALRTVWVVRGAWTAWLGVWEGAEESGVSHREALVG